LNCFSGHALFQEKGGKHFQQDGEPAEESRSMSAKRLPLLSSDNELFAARW
jgi:hypothetical protein